jgi:redox-sensitive bicupin YhaK (pirin superfamily)
MEVEGAKVRVVAGEYGGMQGPVTEIAARPLYMDVSLEPGAAFHMPVPQEHAVYVYIFEGEAAFERDGDAIGAVSMVVYGEGESLRVKASPETKARFLMMAGAPIKEPIVPYGPFVMNTQEEIQQAFIDLQNGTFVQG